MFKIFKVFVEPWRIVLSPKMRFLNKRISDKFYLECMYWAYFKKKISWKNPTDFNEKLQWLKLYDRKDIYTTFVDKYAVKKYVANIIGEQHVIKTFGVWDKFEQIDFDKLPNQFVLKCTHDSSGLVICKDKSQFRYLEAKEKLEKCLSRNFYYSGREWPYKNVRPQIIAEMYMEDEKFQELRDYKFFTFNGVPKIMHLVTNRQNPNEETYGDFFDMEYNHLNLTMGHINNPICPEKPVNFEKMKKFAQILAKNTTHLRVDFYEVNGEVYFGELTFYENSGFIDINPPEWNTILGSWLDLNI